MNKISDLINYYNTFVFQHNLFQIILDRNVNLNYAKLRWTSERNSNSNFISDLFYNIYIYINI